MSTTTTAAAIGLCILAALIPAGALSRDNTPSEQRRNLHREVTDGKFVDVHRDSMPRSSGFRMTSRGFAAVQVNVDDAGNNILGDAANEPSIAIDPTNTDRIVIGWRQFNTVGSSFRQAGYAYSTDGGISWTFPGVIQPGVFRSDPVLDADAEGNFYYNSLTSVGQTFNCDVFISSNGGATWDQGTLAQGGDKQWMTIDKTPGTGTGNIYAFWTSNFSFCTNGSFTRSANRGASYEDCVAIPGNPFWGTLAVGPDGALYACGAGFPDFVMAKSTTARDSALTVSWDTTSFVHLDGDPFAFGGSQSPNPSGLHGQAWVAVDNSTGPHRGNVYVLCSVQRRSIADPLDVMFVRSTDGGITWSPPLRVNDDPGTSAFQWFGTMSVAPNGRIDAVWLDTRDNPGGVNSSLFYSYSHDGGATWSVNAQLTESFDPHVGWPQQQKMGDYFHMISANDGAHLAWGGTFNGEQDVYYGYISAPSVGVADQAQELATEMHLSQNYPNPFNPSTMIRFSVPRSGAVTLTIFNILGEHVATPASGHRNAGEHAVRWDAQNLASGIYTYRLTAGNTTITKRMMVLR